MEGIRLESYRSEWNVRLNEGVPMTLDVALGAGESELDLSTLSITQLNMEISVGAVELDLTGDREQDLDVTIRGGWAKSPCCCPATWAVSP